MGKNPSVKKVFEELQDIVPEQYIVLYGDGVRVGGDFANTPSWSTSPYMDCEVLDISAPSETDSNIIRLEIKIPKKKEEREEKELWDTATKKQNTLPTEKLQNGQVRPERTTQTTKKSVKPSKEDAKQKRPKQK